jgi:two-component system sensor kinase FixL
MHGRVPLPSSASAAPNLALPQRGRGLRWHLIGLVAIALLPALAMVTLVFRAGATAYHQAAEARLAGHAGALALAVARDLTMQRAVIEALVALPEAADRSASSAADLADFVTVARRLAATVDGWVVLWDADRAEQLVNTRLAPDEPVPAGLTPGPMRAAARTERGIVVSNLFETPRLPRSFLGVVAPVPDEAGTIARMIGLHTWPERLLPLLHQVEVAPGGVATLVDGQGRIIARSVDHARWVGQALPGWRREQTLAPRITRRPSLDGVDLLAAVAPVAGTPGWAVAVAEPWQPYAALHNAAFVKSLLGAAGTLGLAVLLVTWLAGRIVRPVERLAADAAQGWTDGAAPAAGVPPSGIREVDALAAAIAEARTGLRHRAAEAERQRALVASVLDAAADPIFAKDLALRFVMANRATNRVIGAPDATLAGRTAFDTADAASATLAEAQDRQVIATGEPWTGEHRILRPEGAQLFITTKVPWRDGDGQVIGVVGVARNVTRARAAEERLAAAQARLLQVSRLGATGAMAAGLAHEINQPLTAVTNYTSAAARLLGDPGSPPPPMLRLEEVRRVLPAATAQARRAGDILSRLRGFISDGAGERAPEPLDEVLHDAAALAAAILAREQAELLLDIPRPLGAVRIDRVQIQQVLLNLLRNAAEAMRDGAVRRVRLSAWRVAPGAAGPGGFVVIEVADTGPGLPEEVAAQLFEPFVTTKPDGLGVGLAICRRAIETHGGTLESVPAAEGGACFRITLPDPDPDPDPDAAPGGAVP